MFISTVIISTALLNKAWTPVLRISDEYKFLIITGAFNLFRLLESETLEMLRETLEIVCEKKCKSKQKFGGAKIFKANQVRKDFVNLKTENEVFG